MRGAVVTGTKQFYDPAKEILGRCLNGFTFEQEYHPQSDRFPPAKLAQDLDEFFSKIPRDTRYHIELRTEAYLAEPVFEVLKKHGVGLVFSNGPGCRCYGNSLPR